METTSATATTMARSARLGELVAKLVVTRSERVEMMSLQKDVIEEQINACMNGTDSITTYKKQLPSLWKSFNILAKNLRSVPPVILTPIPTLIRGETFRTGEWVEIPTETIKGHCIGRSFNRIRWTFRGVLNRGRCIIYKKIKNKDDRGQYPKVTQHQDKTWSFYTVLGDTTLIICSIGGEKHCGLVHISPERSTRKRPSTPGLEDSSTSVVPPDSSTSVVPPDSSTSVVPPVSKKRRK